MRVLLAGLTCLFLGLTSSWADNETEIRKNMPDWLKNFIGFFGRLDELFNDSELDQIVREIENSAASGSDGLLSKLEQCAIGGLFQFMIDNKESTLGTLGTLMDVNEKTADEVRSDPSTLFGKLTSALLKFSSARPEDKANIQFNRIFAELKAIVTDQIPRVCARGEFSQPVQLINKVITKITELGDPINGYPGAS